MAQVAVIGLPEIVESLKKIGINFSEAVLDESVRAGAEVLQREIQSRAPTGDTGVTKRSIIIQRRKPGKGVITTKAEEISYMVGPSKDAYYAYFYEMGTRHQPARSFIKPAFEAVSEAAQKASEDVLLKAAGSIGGS